MTAMSDAPVRCEEIQFEALCLGLRHKGRFGQSNPCRDGLHILFAQFISIQDDACGISTGATVDKAVYDFNRYLSDSICLRIHWFSPCVGRTFEHGAASFTSVAGGGDAVQKGGHLRRNLGPIFFQREVTRIEQMKLEIIQIAFIGIGAFDRKDVIILTPHQ